MTKNYSTYRCYISFISRGYNRQKALIGTSSFSADAWKGRVCNQVKAVTVLTLVKLVLQREDAAKNIMPLFRELLCFSSVDPIIQINIIIGMCDLCSR